MKIYQVPPLAAAIILAVLTMGLVGMFVVLPIACIQWTWNFVVAGISILPQINIWQASLLYLAGAAVLYLLGILQIDVEAKPVD